MSEIPNNISMFIVLPLLFSAGSMYFYLILSRKRLSVIQIDIFQNSLLD